MKSDKIIDAFDTVQPNDEVKNRVFDKAMQKQHKKRPVFKVAASFAAAAAVICLIVLGSMLLMPQDDNIFVIKAYALEVQEDGTVRLQEMDIADTNPEYWGGFVDGESRTMYVGIGLRCEGDDIENVEFSTENGFFAEQYIGNLSDISTEGVPRLYVGPDNQMVKFGNDFDNVGSTITLDKENAEDYLLFWGTNYDASDESSIFMNQPEFPDEITVHAKVTFSNGKTAEKDIAINLSGTGSYSYKPSEEQMAQYQKEHEAYEKLLQSIPLDQCEVVSDSVQTLTYGDTYETGDPLAALYGPITEELMETEPFDQNGVLTISSSLPDDGSDGYIGVIERNKDDTFTGMVYKVPGQLILEYMK